MMCGLGMGYDVDAPRHATTLTHGTTRLLISHRVRSAEPVLPSETRRWFIDANHRRSLLLNPAMLAGLLADLNRDPGHTVMQKHSQHPGKVFRREQDSITVPSIES